MKKNLFSLIILVLTCITALADYTVSNVKATPISPWGRVNITYKLSGSAPSGIDSKTVWLSVTCEDKTTGKKYESSQSALSGDTGVNTGTHQIVWDMAKDGVRLDLANAVFSVEYKCDIIYVVIDLSGGSSATNYPVTYLKDIPSGGWTDEYKTTKLVLRYIKAGKVPRTDVNITLTKDYYIGIFEVTQKQFKLVTGSNPSNFSGDKRPVERVSYNGIRGSSKWPASNAVGSASFLGKLRARTGLTLDLPTEAQWEYACRAGSSGAYGLLSTGKEGTISGMGWYGSNSGDRTHDVGGKTPNAWGLYDMHGNVGEWCLDWYASSGYSGTDPKGASSGSNRVLRGGDYYCHDSDCAASYRSARDPSNGDTYGGDDRGFRVASTLSK